MKKLLLLTITVVALSGDSLQAEPRPERTLWQACFNEAGKVSLPSDVYPYTPPCATWEYLNYGHSPITVGIDYSAVLHYQNITDAVDFWNAALGFEAMIFITEGTPDILITGALTDRNILGTAQPLKIAGRLHNLMTLYGLSTLDTVVHEFGHALGLGHDPGSDYVMAPSGKKRIRVHPEDLKAIRQLYGKP